MDSVEVNTIDIGGKEFFEIDILNDGDIRYDFFAEIDNPENIKVYKLVTDNGEDYLEDVDGIELVDAFKLFNKKYN